MNKFEQLFIENKIHNNDIFYHMYCVNDAVSRFHKTYRKIQLSGLLNNVNNIFVNCVGQHKKEMIKEIRKLDKIVATVGAHASDESETLNVLRKFCTTNNRGNVLYLHSKGVSRKYHNKFNYLTEEKLSFNIQTWIDCMEYFLIEEYNECIKALIDHDTCGIFFDEVPGTNQSAYSGNFWWSTKKYISRLPKCSSASRHRSEYRFLRPHKSKYKNFFSQYKNYMYKKPIERYLYTDKRPSV